LQLWVGKDRGPPEPGWHRLAFVSDSAREGVFFGTDRPSCPI